MNTFSGFRSRYTAQEAAQNQSKGEFKETEGWAKAEVHPLTLHGFVAAHPPCPAGGLGAFVGLATTLSRTDAVLVQIL